MAKGEDKFKAYLKSCLKNALSTSPNQVPVVRILAKDAPKVGQKMADGTFYLGRFVDENRKRRDYFVAAEDAKDKNGKRLSLLFSEAVKYARTSKAHGHSDWRIPTGWDDIDGAPSILTAIFKNKATIKGFDETGLFPSGWYWSSSSLNSHDDGHAQALRLSDGKGGGSIKSTSLLSLRLVRSSAV